MARQSLLCAICTSLSIRLKLSSAWSLEAKLSTSAKRNRVGRVNGLFVPCSKFDLLIVSLCCQQNKTRFKLGPFITTAEFIRRCHILLRIKDKNTRHGTSAFSLTAAIGADKVCLRVVAADLTLSAIIALAL